MNKTPVPSATVIVAREVAGSLEVLMLRRAESMRFVGGMWVFPGGRVDEGDRVAAAGVPYAADLHRRVAGRFQRLEGGVLAEQETLALHIAACRETHEEAGVRLRPEALVYFSHWITPEVSPQRFDTHFFITAMPQDQAVELDARESTDHAWINPEVACAGASKADTLPPPTYMTLRDLAASHRRHGSLEALLRAEAAREVLPILPATSVTGALWDMLMPWDVQYARAPGAFTTHHAWPAHLLELPSRLTFESGTLRSVPGVRDDPAP